MKDNRPVYCVVLTTGMTVFYTFYDSAKMQYPLFLYVDEKGVKKFGNMAEFAGCACVPKFNKARVVLEYEVKDQMALDAYHATVTQMQAKSVGLVMPNKSNVVQLKDLNK